MNGLNLRLRAVSHRVCVIGLGVVVLAGCGAAEPTSPADLAQDRQILTTCVKDKKPAAELDWDVSGSARTADFGQERIRITKAVARRTVICGGHLRVTVFSATSAATAVLYDGELRLPGATDNARLRRVQEAVDEVVEKVTGAYQTGVEKLSPTSSDIVGQYRLAAEYLAQLGPGYRLELVIVTDGIHTADIRVGSASLTPAKGKALAARVNVPKLPGASITVTGLGKVTNGKPVSSTIANGLVAFYDALCAKTGAERCVSVTDFAAAGR